jgi:hypothetical protein
MIAGNKVIDHEITTRTGIPEPMNDLIRNVWFFDPTQATAVKTESPYHDPGRSSTVNNAGVGQAPK